MNPTFRHFAEALGSREMRLIGRSPGCRATLSSVPKASEESRRTLMDGRSCSMEAEYQGSAARGCQCAVDVEKQVLKLQVCCAGHGHLNGGDWQPRVAGELDSELQRRDPRTAAQEFREALRTIR
jgi:hypothetical protein